MSIEPRKINTPADGKYGYIAFSGNEKVELWADSSYEAQKLAVAYFKVKPKKAHQVHVHLAS